MIKLIELSPAASLIGDKLQKSDNWHSLCDSIEN